MDHNIAETLRMLIGMGGATIMSVAAMRVWLRKKELDSRGDAHLDDAVESMRAEIDDLRAEHTQQVAELQERVDFAERLLSKGRPAG